MPRTYPIDGLGKINITNSKVDSDVKIEDQKNNNNTFKFNKISI